MTRQQARAYINGLISTELPKARKKVNGQDSYVCPFCGNGGGKDGTGICTKDGKHYTCFKGCFTSLDYLDILKKLHGTAREGDIFARYEIMTNKAGAARATEQPARSKETATDYTQFFQEAQRALLDSMEARAYLQSRGISLEVARRFTLGYCPEWKSPAALRAGKNPPTSPRMILPTSKSGYTARALAEDTPSQYRFMKEGEAGYLGREALYGQEPVFLVEAAFDALSVYEAGGQSCALGSTSGVDKFLKLLEAEKPTVPLVLALDNDKAGQEAQRKLKEGLQGLGVSCYEVNLSGPYKDPNEHLQKSPEAFKALVMSDPTLAARQEAEAEKEKYLSTAASHHIHAFIGEVALSATTPAIATGFPALDKALDGGLYAGLYILGAVTSLGKTTFLLQAADQIAQGGQDVLIFSLEMSRYELMAKSISRLTLEQCGGYTGFAKTTRGVLDGARWKKYNSEERAILQKSIEIYQSYSHRIFIHEGIGNIGVEQIKQEVQRHMAFTGNAPVVLIDYLQILAPHDERATDKQIVDRAVLELKRLSRDRKIPVIAVSSFNRDNYLAPVNMASFKESGAVEYSSDVLLGFQLAGMDELRQTDKAGGMQKLEEWKRKDPRRVQLKVLKNRNGKVGESLAYDYYPMFNRFREG